jgi:predicted DNA-binding transcriptional regulator AlpA
MKQKKRGHAMHNIIDVPEDPLLLPKVTAELLGVKETTLATWRSKKRFPLRYLKVGKLIRYRQSDVDAFLNGCAQSGVVEASVETEPRKRERR